MAEAARIHLADKINLQCLIDLTKKNMICDVM